MKSSKSTGTSFAKFTAVKVEDPWMAANYTAGLDSVSI